MESVERVESMFNYGQTVKPLGSKAPTPNSLKVSSPNAQALHKYSMPGSTNFSSTI